MHETTALSLRDVTIVDGIPVTTVERTIFDLAAVRSRFTVDLAIDTALRRELTTVDELCAVRPKSRQARPQGHEACCAGSSRERDTNYVPTESEREQMLLRVLRAHGLPEPERQFSIYDDPASSSPVPISSIAT